MATNSIPPPNTALVDDKGLITTSWYRWLVGREAVEANTSDSAESDLILTSGLASGGGSSSGDNAEELLQPVVHDQVVVDAVSGLVEQTGFDSFTKRAIGVGTAASVPTRADADLRYLITGGAAAHAIRTATSSAAAVPVLNDHTLLCDATAGAITAALGPAGGGQFGRVLVFKKIDAGANTVTIDPSGGELIEGAATLVLTTQYQVVRIQSDGTQWWIV